MANMNTAITTEDIISIIDTDKARKNLIEKVEKHLKEHMSEKRRKHTEGVLAAAEKLADKYMPQDENPEEFKERLKVAVLFHDFFRGVPVEELDRKLDEFGIGFMDGHEYTGNPSLAHGKLAAAVMAMEWGVTDRDVLNAVSYHTTGRRNMSPMEKIVFLADAIEENRDYPGLDEIRAAAEESLDKGCLASLKNTMKFLEASGTDSDKIDNDTKEAIDYFEGKEQNIE